MKLCVIITVSQNLYSLYRDQFKFLKDRGVDVTAIAAPGPEHQLLREQGIKTVEIPMCKRPSPFNDLLSLFKLWRHLIFNKYDVISISTPKASLLGAMASFFSHHRNVIFTIRGRAYESEVGLKRKCYMLIDKLICKLSSNVFCISKEISKDFIDSGLVNPNKIFVLGEGSSNGVDLGKFTRSQDLKVRADLIREKFNIGDSDKVCLYSGRLRKDKGITELVEAFSLLNDLGNTHLIIQGAFDDTDPLDTRILDLINISPKIHLAPWSYCVEEYFQCADVFVFPSYREGFGNVAIEASAMELPVIAFDVIGCRESVMDNYTGILVKSKSVEELSSAMRTLIKDEKLAKKLGSQGRQRIEEHFDSAILWEKLLEVYKGMLK
ncbi:glycosyltransferase family 4 protein [Colwellia sp. MB3u-4]|uniref:glycosyltransferase family 4 protein n=1 Tax=Colwellia sp. MB3u-4 TaxID=2759822 RepID=UPI0015F3DFAB|nr:glycosyltransferase family 4 protein [Colwellia sp. MB3u-4]MBA6288672.1 glycosyltransferase family 4 protein [Colwellia sp. MB3u-4]